MDAVLPILVILLAGTSVGLLVGLLKTRSDSRRVKREAAHDVSQSAQLREQVHRRHTELDEEFSELTARLNSALAELTRTRTELFKAEAREKDTRFRHELRGKDLLSQITAEKEHNYILHERIELSEKALTDVQAEMQKYRERYDRIMDVDEEIERLQPAIAELQSTQAELQTKQAELKLVSEDLYFANIGVYRPHYDWDDSNQFRLALDAHYERHKQFIKDGRATFCDAKWSMRGSKKDGAKLTNDLTKLILRAFNAECEAMIAKVRWNNFHVMKKRIEKSFHAINKLVARWKLSLTQDYLSLWLEELILTHEYKEQKEKEREEQRRIRAQIREEQRARREAEKAKEQAEKAEREAEAAAQAMRRLLEAARAEARSEEAAKYEEQLAQLETQLVEAHADSIRATSMAELTKVGHVYIISNIGSFGEDIFKIGMTRRMEPLDRIKELGDASVPFYFDIHGMIYSEDAPKLEADLHNLFWDRRINLVNNRKEFFQITMAEIIEGCEKLGVKVELTLVAEAKEYRQSQALRDEIAAGDLR